MPSLDTAGIVRIIVRPGGLPITAESFSEILRALSFAAHKHRDQRRKDARGSPYINHPIAVAATLWEVGGVRDVTMIIAALLHDTLEDTATSPGELEAAFGGEVRSIVEELTDDQSLTKLEQKRLQLERSSTVSARARQIRLADKSCNIEDLIESPPAPWSVERRREYLRWAGEVIDRLRGANPSLEGHFDRVAAEARLAIEAHEGDRQRGKGGAGGADRE